MPDFQPELVDLILKHIITIDTPLDEVTLTLLRCCLVSHTWRAFAQPYLFSEVLRRSPARDLSNLSDRLCETLSRYEHLKDYITSLSVDAGGLSDPSRRRLFDLIPHVHELVLVADSSPQALPDHDFAELWAHINPSSRLTTLCINAVSDFPIEIFYHVSALERLHLIDAGFSGFNHSNGSLESGSGPVQTKKPKLSDLYVFCSFQLAISFTSQVFGKQRAI
ncbi:hypothetical protein BDN72DRAFT_329499 [Pluteus cervinus]|uniref:Uncharacterized protein n=1 Tax=Pluteus cervinus TaxID=181527 RepID=A0ACD3ACX8_9AGAR|nr:hypothetical protein BDN72DRAFT_329499 [Pluteus cervinus]